MLVAKFNSFWRCLRAVALIATLSVQVTSEAAGRQILLRNETIDTSGPKKQTLRAAAARPVDGLYVVQFTETKPADWREQLSGLNVLLLRPVPEDAFVVELRQASLAQLESLPFVHWVGKYTTKHKTEVKLQALLDEGANRRVRISALLSPRATPVETALMQRRFARLTRSAKTPAGRILEGELSTRSLQALVESKAVLWVEPTGQPQLFDALAGQIIAGPGENNGLAIHDLGFNGEGVTVAVADSGLNLGEGMPMHPDLDGRVDAFFYYGNLLDASDEHSHGTHVTGIVAGSGAGAETDENGFLYGLGIAPGAHIVAQRIFDGEGNYEAPSSMAELTTDAVRAGADIGSNSWGDDTQGRYDISAMEFDALVRDADPETPGDQPYILEFSAGNAGPGEKTIGSPAVAKNVIATGASQNERYDFLIYAGQDGVADFSSRGPCEDGRIKPDVVAPGTWIASAQSEAATDAFAWMGISPLYQYQGGTSQAGPQVSGAAAVFVQYYREMHDGQTPSPALVKAALINSAVDMDNSVSRAEGGTSYVPNMDEGWGRVDLTELIGAERTFDFTDQTSLLGTGQVFERRLFLASGDVPLKITLAYTDVPGFPPAIPALVNDLDLEVIAPDGTIYRGNQFLDGESVPNAPSFDSINNVEAVHVAFPEAGEYRVRVIGREVVEDARRDTAGAIDQDFALVSSGHVPFPGDSVISLDRRAYTVPGEIRLTLIDFDLAGQNTAAVNLTSSSQVTPLAVNLSASGSIGVFTGAVQTASLPVANDGRLHFQHADEIIASYFDVSRAETITSEAVGDFIGPVISNVTSTNRFGRELITWNTDEAATARVFYGTNIASPLAVTNTVFTENHSATVENLAAGQTYFYYIVATDRAGNRTTNNNNGANFSFIARSASTVLLVDAYTYSAGERDDIEIPVTEYTAALDRTGVSYEVWDIEEEGSPTVEDLRPFRVVIWRLNDSFYELNTLSTAEQTLITEYLEGGGSFMISSMDLLTRIGDVPFRTNVLQAAGFTFRTDPFEDCPDCDEDYMVPSIEGADLDSFTAGINSDLDYSSYPLIDLEILGLGTIGPDLSDVFVPTTNAVPIFFEPGGKVAGIRWPKTGNDSTGRVVFLSFPLDAVPLDAPAPNNRANLLRNLLTFLAPGVNGLGTVSLDNTTYTAPSAMTIEVADSDLAQAASIPVVCRNEVSGAEITIQLQPTVRPGVFRGSLTLVRTGQPAEAGQLQVADGEFIAAEYMDASNNGIVRASAEIDLGLPAISLVTVEPEYENATITWETDEFTDALVQFGESPFLGKTAYDSEMDFAHSVLLTALNPDRVYYYRVVSRDTAGNTVIDDNNGNLYTFRTLKPLTAPWSDQFETGADEWSVFDGEESEQSWQLGKPNNFLDTEAHSPDNAWGTNLEGSPIGYMFSNLISPALDLQGGNSATLTFWHNYDFTGEALIEYGKLLLFTNTQTQPVQLEEFTDFTIGWEQQQYDLTPYIGRVVQLVWQYEMFDFSFESVVYPGWMIDDVEVTMGNLDQGRIEITNSLAAAAFTVSGPTSFSGAGRSHLVTNASIGEYTITFSPVPYYNTPAPQTATLNAGETVVFSGNYEMADVNGNGISDSWEQEQFNEVSAGRTAQTDTDQDGLTDLGEFASGTNPNDPGSKLEMTRLEVLLPGPRIQVTWPSVEGKTYRLLASADGQNWVEFSDEIRAAGPETSHTFSPSGSYYLFKIAVIP